ncbi:MAG: SDR family NAD(P)-dependent oxidoreductase [Pirellulales bacterium]|nr:SDR family NAD(P)-dependent oxidoreductase [Pirellulales bacterium]
MHELEVLVLTPAGLCDSAVAIAACRADARGTLDLEYVIDRHLAHRELERLAQFTSNAFGVRLGSRADELPDEILAAPHERLGWVLLSATESAGTDLSRRVSRVRDAGRQVLLEVTSPAEIDRALAAECDGIVLKGHEAAGRVGEETSFVLLQRWNQRAAQVSPGTRLPLVWVQGGIGLNTAAACLVGGAQGVVLDSQVLLARETPLSAQIRARLAPFDGSETQIVRSADEQMFRVCSRGDGEKLEQIAASLASASGVDRQALNHSANELPLALGQDIAFAATLAERYRTVGGIIEAIRTRSRQNVEAARRTQPLAAGSRLAASHATRYPILQGPMTRVSDTAPFADSVNAAGALPFLALALMRGPEVERLVSETSQRLAGRSWGVGLLGFLPPEIRREQVEVIRKYRPPFALIAGGRPDQARELESEGIPTYLHVPSPGLLTMFLRDGAKRFVFEGRECGGHVGPRTSFVLWETMCELLLAHLGERGRGNELHVAFAGGLHDALSAAMVSAIAAPLAERGVAIGALIGTAYLFTQEAVDGGAIVPRFQQEAVESRDTVLLETGPGHAIRCLRTPYYDDFQAEKRRLEAQGVSHEELVRALEWMNIGRLRVASKGLDRVDDDGSPRLAQVSAEEQYARGMYMIGQVSSLREGLTTMAELHAQVCDGSSELLEHLDADVTPLRVKHTPPPPCDVAIIGMSCFYPQAIDLRHYWHNILAKSYAVTEVPATHWDWQLYYDPDPLAKDKIYSKWGGFMPDVAIDPFEYGIAPASLKSIEPLQLLLLEAVKHALSDAGYERRPFHRERTAAILGIGGGGSPLATAYGFRTCLPLIDNLPDMPSKSSEIIDRCQWILPEWTEDSFPGFLFNVGVGRVANRFNFGGTNMAIDAACASSLAALDASVRELTQGTADVAVSMGADTVQTPFAYMAFSKTHALSRRGRCSPFDAQADGIVLSEGIGVVILKRLADAERDGDHIIAVIKGIGSSSDGREKGLTAPNAAGQLRALRRAYEQARVSPASIELVEAHGTGTVVGDRTESEALAHVWQEADAEPQSCALGSVKSLIGHTKCAAGIGGLIKVASSLERKVLPPTLVETPNPNANFTDGPLYLNTQPRPWIHSGDTPRRAGVSAFGFGGTNFHVVLEEYRGSFLEESRRGLDDWPAELFLFRRASRAALTEAVARCRERLTGGAQPALVDLAAAAARASSQNAAHPTVAIVAGSRAELNERLSAALDVLRTNKTEHRDPRGVYFCEKPAGGEVALLFPGQGSQYPNMLDQVAMAFPAAREVFDRAQQVLDGTLDRSLGRYIYPASSFSDEREKAARDELARADVAQPALGAASLAMLRVLRDVGLQGSMLAGHSYGEYVALAAAGAIGFDDVIRLSHRRGALMRAAVGDVPTGMAAVEAEAAKLEQLFTASDGITIANRNAPTQTVIAGTIEAVDAALAKLKAQGIRGRRISVSAAFHSPHIAPAQQPLAEALAACTIGTPQQTVYSNRTAEPHTADASTIAASLVEHLTSPVRFQEEIEAMYAAGARTFVEVGPQGVLTGLVGQILGERPHVAVATDNSGRPGLVQLAHALAQLSVAGVPLSLGAMYAGRESHPFALDELTVETGKRKPSPSTWLVNGVRSRPLNGPEPPLLGQRLLDYQFPKSEDNGATSGAKPRAAQASPVERAAPPAPVAPPASATTNRSTQTPAPTGAAAPSVPVRNTTESSSMSHGNGSAAGWTPVPPQAAADDATLVMLRYQDLMARFLDTQRSVMLTYLGGAPEAAPVAPLTSAPQQGMALAAYAPQAMPAYAAPPVPAAPVAQPAASAAVTPASAVVATNAEPAAVPAVAAAAPAAVEFNLETISSRLLELVSKRTGYPKEMLDLDLDLEADLGIDSIKRVEILGTLAESIEDAGTDMADTIELEKLTTIRNLRGILEYLEKALFSGDAQGQPALAAPATQALPAAASSNGAHDAGGNAASTAAASTNGDAAAELEVQRALVELIDAPLPTGGSLLIPSGAVLVTDDGRGIARTFASRLADFGQQLVIVRHAEGMNGSPTNGHVEANGVFFADFADPQSVEAMLGRIRSGVGKIGGLVHLAPLAELPTGDQWATRAYRDVRSLYLLARGLEQDLRQAAEAGGALLLAGTGIGGGLGFAETSSDEVFPGHGAIVGFMKCVALEWPQALVRVVDLDVMRSTDELAERLLAELNDADGPAEVGYLEGRRVTWEPVQATIEASATNEAPLAPNSTVLITGGARGITAAVALELAKNFQPHLVIVGRSPLPAEEEAAATLGENDTARLKAIFIEQLRAAGEAIAPAAVEAAYQRLLQDREIRGNLAALRAAGATVEYHSLDVRHGEAFGRLLEDLHERRGGIDGVIHGAGVIEDKLLADKTPESFDRVFRTKVESALTICRHVRPEQLKFCVFFSSLASRYGNRGQSDYAAANEFLSKLAWYLDRRWPGRVLAIAWGPWSGLGMVADLEKHLVRRGLKLISPEEGPRFVLDELRHGEKGESEVVIAGGAANLVQPVHNG